ncbi:hypothetical protein E3N88_29489 [Mikania micrantha]|uniref:Uncharacterized protein n=1 Tax=Mikania micrantha TaxID=192012 RepID=A0A5N6MJL6_9ASTR|nr:hypothetical protein E3N88_29489 [Mikania micrantha]
MADQGERYIYQRFPYIVLDDTPGSSAGPDSDPSEASSAASQATPALPRTPSAPRSPTPPPPSPLPPPPAQVASPGRSQPRAENVAAEELHSPSPQRVPVWDGLRRIRGQARKTTSSDADLQGLRQGLHQHQTTLEDTRATVLEILTSHLILMEQVNLMGIDTQAWKTTVEERLNRTSRQALVAAFWQQVAVWRERLQGWTWMLGMMSIEARLLCLAIVLATIAIVLACLRYFLR